MNDDEKKFEELLRDTFSASTPPPEALDRALLAHLSEKEKEQCLMKCPVKRFSLLAAVFCLLLCGTAFASWHFLSVASVVKEISIPALSRAFDSADAEKLNAVRTQKGYLVSLLGLTNGEALIQADDTIRETSTYAVVAIAKEDGTPLTDEDAFFVSPLIQGLEPWQYNIASMHGGYQQFIENGILYRLIECDNIELFADKKLYLCVSDTNFFSVDAFSFDEKTGAITEKPNYDGLNILFDLPLDAAKADPEKAKAYVDTLWAEEPEDTDTEPAPLPTAAEILEMGTVFADSVQTLIPDEKGMLSYSYTYPDGGQVQESISEEVLFPNGSIGLSEMYSTSMTADGEKNNTLLYEKAANGTITARCVAW